jgi:hypothetical protein
MTLDQLNKKTAREIIADAMKIFRGPSYVKQPKKVISSGNYGDEQRTDRARRYGIRGPLQYDGGSAGAVNLYKLIETYLWDPLAQSEINAVVARRGV